LAGQAPVALPAVATPVDRAALSALGRVLFFDPHLSASGQQSCASCHDPAHAYAPASASAVQLGGADMKQPGLRAVPSLRYTLGRTPRWSKQYESKEVERLIDFDSQPVGGFTLDGRVDTARAQALIPLLAPNEMANEDASTLAAKVRDAPYADEFRKLFGPTVFDDPARTLDAIGRALERFETDDPSFHPYSSKFDAFLDGKTRLSASEQRGYTLFVAPDKGNCASCHLAAVGADGSHPLFTDFSFHAFGAPRNPRIPANADPRFHDLGICGPLRKDYASRDESLCGMFKTPTLRNVATRHVFFHNGYFTTLEDVLSFYVTRDIDAARWYPLRDGQPDVFDDLPPELRKNVDQFNPPFNRRAGQQPALSRAELVDLAAFLRTLDDGWQP
jgi:cytochrome c peroxidase